MREIDVRAFSTVKMSETATSFVTRILEKWLPQILVGEAVAVPDDDEEMNWRLFFAHSQDMQGFAADIFTGGKNERSAEGWTGLRDRWNGTSHALMADLARIWERYESDLKSWSHPHKSQELTARGIAPLLDLLLSSQVPGAEVFGLALRDFKGARPRARPIRCYALMCKMRRFLNRMASATGRILRSSSRLQCLHGVTCFKRKLNGLRP
jgi:hypothetical protein